MYAIKTLYFLSLYTQRWYGRHNVSKKNKTNCNLDYRFYCMALFHSQTQRHIIEKIEQLVRVLLCAYNRRKCTKYDTCELVTFSHSVPFRQLHISNYFRFVGCHCSKGHLPLTSFLYWHCKLLIQIDVTSAMFVSS